MATAHAPDKPISRDKLRSQLLPELWRTSEDGQSLLVIMPDNTRTLPMPALFETFCEALAGRSRKLTFLIASGTHTRMTEDELSGHLGAGWRDIKGIEVLQHEWENPEVLARIGSIPRGEARRISRGIIDEEIPVQINRQVLEHDLVFLVGPVFPHELIGFSGGYKYFFPGVSGPEMVHQSHWLGSVLVNPDLHGCKNTPARELIHHAASLVRTPALGVSLVMKGRELMGIFTGQVLEAWSQAADLSSQLNIVQVDRPYHTVIACVPSRYQDLWIGSKCMTKLQNVVADGGTLILYAPHIRHPALSHGDWHRRFGYHLPEYVLQNPECFREVPKVVLGDLIQLRGSGVARDGVEIPRIRVVVASNIPAEDCRGLNLIYRDPASTRLEEYEGREKEGVLVVREAGETLWTLASDANKDAGTDAKGASLSGPPSALEQIK